LRSAFPETFQGPTDENEYFRIANCLRQWDFSKPFAYTIGYPLFCIPFICLINSDNFNGYLSIYYSPLRSQLYIGMEVKQNILPWVYFSAWLCLSE
jgi:hypothetical protein